jgi:hypothetical protein
MVDVILLPIRRVTVQRELIHSSFLLYQSFVRFLLDYMIRHLNTPTGTYTCNYIRRRKIL